MAVQIKRTTGIYGSYLKFDVLINDEKIKTIGTEGIVDLEAPNDKATIQLSQGGLKTNELEVTDGDTVEVTTTFWRSYGMSHTINK